MKLYSFLLLGFVILLISAVPTQVQGYGDPFYIDGYVYREGNGDKANGVLYLWFDANDNSMVDWSDRELETVEIVDGHYQSLSMYGTGLRVFYQTHTDGDYVETGSIVMPDIGVNEHVAMMPSIYVRQRDPDPTVRLLDSGGHDLMLENISVTGQLDLVLGVFIDQGFGLGQEGYFDYGAQSYLENWAVAYRVQGNIYPTDFFDFAVTDPFATYYYYLLDTIYYDPVEPYAVSLSHISTWEVLGDANVTIQFYDPVWLMGDTVPFIHHSGNITFHIVDYVLQPVGEIEWYYDPADLVTRPGGAIWDSGDYPIDGDMPYTIPDWGTWAIISMLVLEYPYPLPMTLVLYYVMLSRDGRKFRRKLIYGLSRPSRKKKELWDHTYQKYKDGEQGFETYGDIAEKLGVHPSTVSHSFREARARQEIVEYQPIEMLIPETITPDIEVKDNGKPVWTPTCMKCGAPIEDPDIIEESRSLGTYWRCDSCGTVNVIEGGG